MAKNTRTFSMYSTFFHTRDYGYHSSLRSLLPVASREREFAMPCPISPSYHNVLKTKIAIDGTSTSTGT